MIFDSKTLAENDASAASAPARSDRLDSWKEIATYLRREVRTVQLWEKNERLPIHRHFHKQLGSVFAYRSEIDRWQEGMSQRETAGRSSQSGKLIDDNPVAVNPITFHPALPRQAIEFAQQIVAQISEAINSCMRSAIPAQRTVPLESWNLSAHASIEDGALGFEVIARRAEERIRHLVPLLPLADGCRWGASPVACG